jgi:riboflavin synthase
MFTGIVEEMGALVSADRDPAGVAPTRLVFSASLVLEGSGIGDSIAVNGCCLTVTATGPGWWGADAVAETLARTNLGALSAGDPVNLERPLAAGSRLGGHLVQGHVDGVGEIVTPAPELAVRFPPALRRYLVEKGSITVDGISLTVVSVTDDVFTVAVIPHTLEVTILGRKVAGATVNLEVDVIAKYAEQLLRAGTNTPYARLGVGEG